LQGNPKILSLFKPFSKLGAKKSISFKENVTSFAVELSYDNETDLPLDTPHKLALYKVEDMEKLKKYNYTGMTWDISFISNQLITIGPFAPTQENPRSPYHSG